jgi:hypothetical protein
MEPEGSIPNPQQLSTCPYPERDQSSPHHPIPPLQDPPSTEMSTRRKGKVSGDRAQSEGARCSLVVKALGYKPEVRGFESRWGEILMSTGNIKKNVTGE